MKTMHGTPRENPKRGFSGTTNYDSNLNEGLVQTQSGHPSFRKVVMQTGLHSVRFVYENGRSLAVIGQYRLPGDVVAKASNSGLHAILDRLSMWVTFSVELWVLGALRSVPE